ncbi:MAG: carboxy terminal-processing peptidase [Gammaproteobacteria bacterium]|nr:carboxy terminal-processing peptidase [Gammaproteobacteria bacterium]
MLITLRLFLVIQFLFFCFGANANETNNVPKDYLSFSPKQAETSSEILKKLTTQHFRKQKVNDQFSKKFLFEYLDALDPTKSYFLQEDIDEFKRWEDKLDDMLLAKDLSVGFLIFNRFKDRVTKQLQANIDLLKGDFIFDLTKDEVISLDIENAQWQPNKKKSSEHWQRKVTEAYLRLILNEKEPETARELLTKRYKNQKKRLKQNDSEDVFQIYMSVLAGMFDPHTSYLSPKSMENFRISMSLSLTGIGAVLELDGEYTSIVSIIKGGPAEKQGILKTGDKIVSVAQNKADFIDVVGWRLDDVVELIRGKKDSLVRLEIIPAKTDLGGNTQVIELIRDKIKLEEQAAKSKIIDVTTTVGSHKFGVIEIPAFYLDVEALYNNEPDFKSTTKDVVRLINDLHTKKNVDGIILDLRNNGGGFLQEAKMLTDLFIGKGPIVQVKNSNNYISQAHQSRSSIYYRGPILVLINRLSASASEIFAGAIQDYGRGIIVGSRSYGKGTVQIQLPLEQGEIKLTESKFYRVSGESTQLLGVTPDIELPSIYDPDEIGESSLNNALPWDTIAPAKHSIFWSELLKTPPINMLRAAHEKRLLVDPDLIYLNEELSLIKKQSSMKEISLNEKKRRLQSKEYNENLLALENKRRVAKNQKGYSTFEEWQTAADKNKDAAINDENLVSSENDPILHEAGNIFADYIGYVFSSPPGYSLKSNIIRH